MVMMIAVTAPVRSDRVVYLLIDPSKDEVFYVGKGAPKRPYDHEKTAAATQKLYPTANKIRQLLKRGLRPRIKIVASELSDEEACKLEVALIKQHGRKLYEGGTLLNMTRGGDGLSGHVLSKEHRRKIGLKTRGHKAPNKRKVYQYTLSGKFLREWDSLREAAQSLEVSNIHTVCIGKKRHAGLYRWSYDHVEQLQGEVKPRFLQCFRDKWHRVS